MEKKPKSYAFLTHVEKPSTTTISCIVLIRITRETRHFQRAAFAQQTARPDRTGAININPFLSFSVSLRPVLTLPRGQRPSTVQPPPFGTVSSTIITQTKTVGARTRFIHVRVSPDDVLCRVERYSKIFFTGIFPPAETNEWFASFWFRQNH